MTTRKRLKQRAEAAVLRTRNSDLLRQVAGALRDLAEAMRTGSVPPASVAVALLEVADALDLAAAQREMEKAAKRKKAEECAAPVHFPSKRELYALGMPRPPVRIAAFSDLELAGLEAALGGQQRLAAQEGETISRREALRRLVATHNPRSKESATSYRKNVDRTAITLEKALARYRAKAGAALRPKSPNKRKSR